MRNLKSFIFFTVTAVVAGAYAISEARANRVNARRAAADGTVTDAEKARLEKMQDRAIGRSC